MISLGATSVEQRDPESSDSGRVRASVIVCVFNREKAIVPCLQSLEDQIHPGLEVVVVDDGSTDGTPNRLEELRTGLREIELVLVTNPQNVGISASRNRGIAAASGDLILFTDSDCVADPGWLEIRSRMESLDSVNNVDRDN